MAAWEPRRTVDAEAVAQAAKAAEGRDLEEHRTVGSEGDVDTAEG